MIGIDDLILEINNNPCEDIVLQATCPLVLTSSILIANLPVQMCNKELLDMYFTNKKRSGIDSYKEIEILDDNRAIVHLESKDGMYNMRDVASFHLFCILCPCRYASLS